MKKKVEIFESGGRIVYRKNKKTGPPEIREFNAIRCGFTWQRGSTPGYFTLIGQEHFPQTKTFIPYVQIAEGTSSRRTTFYQKLFAACKLWHCKDLFASIGHKYRNVETGFYNYLKRFGNLDINLCDVSELVDLSVNASGVEDRLNSGELTLLKKSILSEQALMMSDGHLKGDLPLQHFYAVVAMNYVMSSFDVFPHEPVKKSKRSWGKFEGYGGG